MHAKNEVSFGKLLQILSDTHITLEWCDLLLHPRRERMRACSKDLEIFFSSKADDRSPEPYNLFADLRGCMTDAASHLEHRLMQLWLNILDRDPAILQDLGDVGAQLAGLRVDNLVLLLNPERERWCLHGLSFGRAKPDLIISGYVSTVTPAGRHRKVETLLASPKYPV